MEFFACPRLVHQMVSVYGFVDCLEFRPNVFANNGTVSGNLSLRWNERVLRGGLGQNKSVPGKGGVEKVFAAPSE